MPSIPLETFPIAAIATATGRGGIGVVRLSGKNLAPIVPELCGISLDHLTPRFAHFLAFKAADNRVIDHGLVMYFPAPHSYTGEEILEFQGHGGPVVLRMLLARCLEAGTAIGLRLAQPGEFTRRAFLNNKMDLAQAEAVADLIDASTEAAAKSAFASLSGAFSKEIATLVEQVIHLRMRVEATLDFPEEEIDFLEKSKIQTQLTNIRQQLNTVFTQAAQGALLRDGLHVVLAGQPNVGKSSLLNVLAGNDVAIVTAIAGTTRDKIIETISLEGIPVHIVDTAGIRHPDEANDEIERLGIARTWQEVNKADAIVHILDACGGPTVADNTMMKRFPENIPVLKVWNKIDQSGHPPTIKKIGEMTHIYLSAKEQIGIHFLRSALLSTVGWQKMEESLYLARERHLSALRAARNHLTQAAEHIVDKPVWELCAEELRLTQDQLNTITGEFTSDNLLGMIFSRFCIGK